MSFDGPIFPDDCRFAGLAVMASDAGLGAEGLWEVAAGLLFPLGTIRGKRKSPVHLCGSARVGRTSVSADFVSADRP